jgi:hypothetical protein
MKASAFLFLGLLLSTYITAPVYAKSNDELRLELGAAFTKVAEAESAGGDVSDLVQVLNLAASLIDKGDDASLKSAEDMIQYVSVFALEKKEEGVQATNYQHIVLGATLGALVASAAIIWFYGSRVFWALWFRTKRNWRVEAA